MLRNISYNNKDIIKEINEHVGRPYGLMQRVRMKGVGSRRMMITDASEDIMELLALDNNMNFCNMELRPDGIILRFRSLLETYGLVINFHQLNVFQNGKQLSIYGPEHYVKVVPAHGQGIDKKFILKILDSKARISTLSHPFF